MKKEKGSILIFTLWVLIILAILTISLSHRASSDVRLARRESHNIKTVYLARAGVMKMLTELAKDTNSYDSLNEDWNRDGDNPKELKLGDGIVYYSASDEVGRLNLNSVALSKAHLVRLGIDEALAEKILKYKIEKGAKGFEFMEELFLVEGMNQEAYSRIKDLATIYRGEEPTVNINTASRKVLEVVLGGSTLVQDILEYREGPDGQEGTDDDGIFRETNDISMIAGLDPALFSVKSNVFRISAEASFSEDEGITKSVEAILNKKSGQVYHWREY